MIALLTIMLVVSTGISLGCLIWAVGYAGRVSRREHAQCMAQVAHYTGNTFAAQVLEAAAEDYEKTIQTGELLEVRRTFDLTKGSVPAQWLNKRAEDLRNSTPS